MNSARSRKLRCLVPLALLISVAMWLPITSATAGPLTPGNVVIYHVGDGSVPLTNKGSPVFLDEYTPSGTLVQSIPMPTAANGSNRQLIASGTATAEGFLTLSTRPQLLGFDRLRKQSWRFHPLA